jgi:hypothetical protein
MVPGCWRSQISRHSAHKCSKIVSRKHGPPLPPPPSKYHWYSFLLGAESTPGPYCSRKDYISEKIPMMPSGIEPATFHLLPQCLNHLCHRVSPFWGNMFPISNRVSLILNYVSEKFQWHHVESNPRPSALYHSASINCATACPLFEVICFQFLIVFRLY